MAVSVSVVSPRVGVTGHPLPFKSPAFDGPKRRFSQSPARLEVHSPAAPRFEKNTSCRVRLRVLEFCFGMYLLNIDALVADLRVGRVRVRDALFHKVILIALVAVSWICWDIGFDVISTTHVTALLLCQAFAIYLCYCANGYGAKSARIARFSMVGACVGLRILCCVALVLTLDPPFEFWESLLGRAAAAPVFLQSIAPHWIACGCSVLWGWRVAVHMERAADDEWSARSDGDCIPAGSVNRRANFFVRHDERSR